MNEATTIEHKAPTPSPRPAVSSLTIYAIPNPRGSIVTTLRDREPYSSFGQYERNEFGTWAAVRCSNNQLGWMLMEVKPVVEKLADLHRFYIDSGADWIEDDYLSRIYSRQFMIEHLQMIDELNSREWIPDADWPGNYVKATI